MSKSPTQTGTNTTTTTNAPPQYVQDAQQALLALGLNLNAPFMGSAPQYALAGFNPDQTMAFDLARSQAQGALSYPGLQVSDFGNTLVNPASASAASSISAPQLAAAAQAQAAMASAGQAQAASLGPAAQTSASLVGDANRANASNSEASQLDYTRDIQPFLNPYTHDVIDTSTQQLEEANARQLAAIRARQGAESAYGGNRGALQESEQNRNFGNTLASTVAQLNQAGWNKAADLGTGNAQMRQQTGLANQQWQNQVGLANAASQNQFDLSNQQWQNQIGMSNTNATNSFAQLQAQLQQQAAMANAAAQTQVSVGNAAGANQIAVANANSSNTMAALQAQLAQQAGIANAANQQQTNLANAGYAQQANLFNAQQPLQTAQMQGQLNQQNWQQQMQALQALLMSGNQQQQFAQQAINVPYTALQNFASLVPNQYGSSGTSSQPIYGPSTLQTIASLAPLGIAAGQAFGLSDRTMKTDIQKLGKDKNTDLDMYAYRYKGDPKNTMKNVGPMAQDVEKKYPGSTQRIGGKLAIKGSARQMLGI